MLKLPYIAVRELVFSLWRRVRFGPIDPAWSWRTSTVRDVLAALTDEVIAEIQRRNRCYVSGAAWKGKKIMRVSISSGETDFDAIDLLAEETLAAWRKVRERA